MARRIGAHVPDEAACDDRPGPTALFLPFGRQSPTAWLTDSSRFCLSKYRIERALRSRYPDRAAWADSRGRPADSAAANPRKRDRGRTASGADGDSVAVSVAVAVVVAAPR